MIVGDSGWGLCGVCIDHNNNNNNNNSGVSGELVIEFALRF
jgi:hypothetical protein